MAKLLGSKILSPIQLNMNNLLKTKAFVFIIAILFSFQMKGQVADNKGIVILKNKKSLAEILASKELKGKVVYGDMWGANCKPCIEELRNYTPALKEQYANNDNLVFLYVSINFNKKVLDKWKELIVSQKMTGYHLSIENLEDYRVIFNQVVGSKDNEVAIPRYFIADGLGNIVVRNAKKPSDTTRLYSQIDSVMAMLPSSLHKK